MYRFVQALLLTVIAGYIAWMTWDLQNVHKELRQVEQSIVRMNHVADEALSSQGRSQRFRPDRVDVTTANLAYAFKPATLLVKVGAAVTWMNTTAASHSVTSKTPGIFDQVLKPHSQVTIVFRSIGAYPYYCRFHPYQRGEIVVVP